MSVMFDTGGILSGSHALEIFVPDSIDSLSDWDFYVPGYKELVADMINVLSLCGVTWHPESDYISVELEASGKVTVKCQVLQTLSLWLAECPDAFGPRLQQVLKAFKEYNLSYYYSSSCTITLSSDDKIVVRLHSAQLTTPPETGYTDISGEPFSIIRGTIQGATGVEPVQLIVGCYYSGIRSCLSMVKDFYATHVQCFIGGWCAGHMYYRQAKDKKAIVWRRTRDKKVQKGIEKYSRRGYSFEDAATLMPKIRHFKDDEALFVDYGDLYRLFMYDPSLLDQWLQERRENIDSIEWTEFGGQIVSFYSLMACLRKGMSYTTWTAEQQCKGPYRLVDIIASSGIVHSIKSTLNKTLAQEDWTITEAAKSGSLFAGLPEASPWSWIM
ncbi:hypothetical protein V2G26_010745 [Clonostachys chloroleuca]